MSIQVLPYHNDLWRNPRACRLTQDQAYVLNNMYSYQLEYQHHKSLIDRHGFLTNIARNLSDLHQLCEQKYQGADRSNRIDYVNLQMHYLLSLKRNANV